MLAAGSTTKSMSFFFMLTSYVAVVLSLVTGAFLALAVFTSPVESESSASNRPKSVKVDLAKHIVVEPSQPAQSPQLHQAFRYGPDANHGRSDTPVNARQQALNQARAGTPVKTRQLVQERAINNPGIAMGFAPSIRSSGH